MLLELGDDARHEVHRVLVVFRLAEVAGRAEALQVGLDAVGQEAYVVEVATRLLVVLREARDPGRVADRAVGPRPQGDLQSRMKKLGVKR